MIERSRPTVENQFLFLTKDNGEIDKLSLNNQYSTLWAKLNTKGILK